MIDVQQQINAVRRVVGTRTLEAGEARTVTVSQVYPTTIDDLWDACTNADRIPRWFLPVSGELREGGRYALEGNASGTVTGCNPPKSFTATWEYGGEVSWIEVRLTEEDPERTRFELEHIAHVDDTKWWEFGPGAVGIGWDLGLVGLGMHLASGETVNPEEVQRWSASPAGVEFVTSSGNAWFDADVAGGSDPELSRAAADRTITAYTATE